MTVPNPADFQQLHNGDPYGGFDCTAWSTAWVLEAQGKPGVTGTQIRAHTNEPKPDPKSPGLNLPQCDDAARKLTGVDLDTRLGDPILDAQTRLEDGRWGVIQVDRGVLIAHGLGGENRFAGGHAEAIHVSNGAPVLGDPLLTYYLRATWAAVWAAARPIAGAGRAHLMFTRDLTADYHAVVDPVHKTRLYWSYAVNPDGTIKGRHQLRTAGFRGECTPPRWHPWQGHVGRSLVQLTTGGHKGEWIHSHLCHETPGSSPK